MNPSTPITPTTLPKPSGKLIEIILFMMIYALDEADHAGTKPAGFFFYGRSIFKTLIASCRNLSRAFASTC